MTARTVAVPVDDLALAVKMIEVVFRYGGVTTARTDLADRLTALIEAAGGCIAEGHWTAEWDDETGMVETVHDPDEGPCEFPPTELDLLREALEACVANIEETGSWGLVALNKTRAALAALPAPVEGDAP